jgi:hypothetical protein
MALQNISASDAGLASFSDLPNFNGSAPIFFNHEVHFICKVGRLALGWLKRQGTSSLQQRIDSVDFWSSDWRPC